MTDRNQPTLEDVLGNGKHWRVTNTMEEAIDLEIRTASGTRMVARMPIGATFDIYPASKDDANILFHATDQKSGPRKIG
jgi:hypothetical protein